MFCSNCGKQVEDSAAFCSGCGTSLNSQPQPNVQTPPPVYQSPIVQQSVQQPAAGKPATKKGRTVGIVLLVLSILSIIGGSVNGAFERYAAEGLGMADFVSVAIQIGLFIGGVYLIIKNKKQ